MESKNGAYSPEDRKKLSVFFSYGHDCESIVTRIKDDLSDLGYEIWIDRCNIKEGNEWRERITSGILKSDTVMAFLSKHALRKNSVCLNELSIAVGCKYGHIKTVLLEPDIERLLPSTLSAIQYCDMSKWRILKTADPQAFELWYQEKLQSIIRILSDPDTIECNSQLKYLEQMLSPAIWQLRQQTILQKQYIPRVELEETLRLWMEEPNDTPYFLLYGEPGCGKSSFMVNYHHFNHEAAAIAFCDWKRKSRDRVSEIIRSIAAQLATKIPAYRSSLVWHLENRIGSIFQLDDASLFENLIVNPMYGLIHDPKEVYLILIDSINVLNENGSNPLAEILAEEGQRLPRAIRFVISTRVGDVVNRYFPACKTYEFVPTSEVSTQLIRQFYELKLENILSEYSEAEANNILDKLADRSEGNFLFAELCGKSICEGKMNLNELSNIPGDLNGIYYRWFTTLFPNIEEYLDRYYIPLSVLCAVEDSIPQELLRGIMGWNTIAYRRFLTPLKDFLKIQNNAFGKATVTLFHSSMATWLISDHAGIYSVDTAEGLTAIKEQLLQSFEAQTITPYQCKILISVLEKVRDAELRKRVYGSDFFFQQYYSLAKAYETIRNGYHKAILIYIHLKEICQGLPSAENLRFLDTVYPIAISRCYCQIGDYHAVKPLLEENLSKLEKHSEPVELMEAYYILGSVYDWMGQRKESVEIFIKLNTLATEHNHSVYILRSIIGLIWNEHFTNMDIALRNLKLLSSQDQLDDTELQMAELVYARVLLSEGKLRDALDIYDRCLDSFDFSFRNDVRGYRKNRMMLLEILPACYDMDDYEKGVNTGKLIMEKIKHTGWMEECYCASWIALNYLGMGDVSNAERYLRNARWHLNSVSENDKSHWMFMHLSSIEAFIAEEKGDFAEAVSLHKKVMETARLCNDPWVEGDACFELSKLILYYGLQDPAEAATYADRLKTLADSSKLAHLILKDTLLRGFLAISTGHPLREEDIDMIDTINNRNPLASTNYIDVYCIKSLIYKSLGNADKLRDSIFCLRELIQRPENKKRAFSLKVHSVLRHVVDGYVDFNVEYCDPYETSQNYWMRLEHLGRYLWACEECKKFDRPIVADIACANGYGTLMLSGVADEVQGFDRSGDYLASAPKRDNIKYAQCDIDTIPLEAYENQFDMVVSFETIEHVKDPARLIRLFSCILKSQGQLLLSFPNSKYEKLDEYGLNKDHYHLHIFEREDMIRLLEAEGFRIDSLLGQSYCNLKCNEENNAIKAGLVSAKELEASRASDMDTLFADAHAYAIPGPDDPEETYSFILKCTKVT